MLFYSIFPSSLSAAAIVIVDVVAHFIVHHQVMALDIKRIVHLRLNCNEKIAPHFIAVLKIVLEM